MEKDTILLSTDTSSPKFSAAILKGDMLLDEFVAAAFNRHSGDLLPAIDKLISKNSYSVNDIGAFCIGLGPGSFTGLRIGITTIRALAMVLKKPILGVPSIDGLAHNLLGHKGQICVIIDAKQNKLYTRIYYSDGKEIKPKSKFLLVPITELLNKIRSRTIFVGDGIRLYGDLISKRIARLAEFAPEAVWYPRASVIGKIGLDKLRAGKRDNVFNLSPLYIYPRECQIRKTQSSR
jgi:tRNA threonylcarbamoyladenosine biosynthesis protein TsaB